MFVNYVDPQILPMSRTLHEKSGHQFVLAATEEFPEELLEYGYENYNLEPYVKEIHQEADPIACAKQLAKESDILIYAHSPVEYFNLSVETGKPVFRLSQHIYRDGNLSKVSLKMKGSYFVRHTLALKNKPVYLMCLGTYTANDFSQTGSYQGKKYEFGEFTETLTDSYEALLKEKENSQRVVLWANSIQEYTHPEVFIDLAEQFRSRGWVFEMIPTTENDPELLEKIKRNHGNVHLFADLKKEDVFELMRKAELFVMTSDYNEGWGSILNDAMNHGCAPLVSTAVGSSKMIDANHNGLLYINGDPEDLSRKLSYYMDHLSFARKCGENAYLSIRNHWNGILAGERLYDLMEALSSGRQSPFQEGLCSEAKEITQTMMKKMAGRPLP